MPPCNDAVILNIGGARANVQGISTKSKTMKWKKVDDIEVSELQIMKSAAGYYIGKSYRESGFEGPYSRNSEEYFKTPAEAHNALRTKNYTYKEF